MLYYFDGLPKEIIMLILDYVAPNDIVNIYSSLTLNNFKDVYIDYLIGLSFKYGLTLLKDINIISEIIHIKTCILDAKSKIKIPLNQDIKIGFYLEEDLNLILRECNLPFLQKNEINYNVSTFTGPLILATLYYNNGWKLKYKKVEYNIDKNIEIVFFIIYYYNIMYTTITSIKRSSYAKMLMDAKLI